MATYKALFLLLFLALLAFMVYFARRARVDRSFWVRAPRRRHPILRALCAILGFGLLAAVAVGTWLDARADYADEAAPAATLRLPSRPSPLPSSIPPAPESVDLDKGRFLLHVVVVQESLDEVGPVQAVEYELRLPEDRGKEFRPSLELPGYGVEFSFSVDKIQAGREDGTVVLNPWGDHSLTLRRRLGTSSSSGTLHGVHVRFVGHEPRVKNLFSISPGAARSYSLFVLPTLVADDDPLRRAAAAELMREKEGLLRAALKRDGRSLRTRAGVESDAPGVSLMDQVGATSLLLLLAAVLLSQVARRKSLAFAGWLAAIVVLAGAMDRAALGLHASRLENAQAPVRDRRRACARMADTFFFRKTARDRVEKALQDPAVKDVARTTLTILE